MHQFKIKVTNSYPKDDSEPKFYCGLFESELPVEYVFDSLHTDGLIMDLYKDEDQVPVIIHSAFQANFHKVIKKLEDNYALIEKLDDVQIPAIDSSEYILFLGEIDGLYHADDHLKIEDLLREDLDPHEVLYKKVNAFDFGASGHHVDFLISLGAGLAQKSLEKLLKVFSKNNIQHFKTGVINISEVKSKLSSMYDVNEHSLQLISTRLIDQSIELKFKTRAFQYDVKIDEKSGIVLNSERLDLSQTGI